MQRPKEESRYTKHWNKSLCCAQEHILSHKPPANCLFTLCLCFPACSGNRDTETASRVELRSKKQHRLKRWAQTRLTGTCIPVLRLCVLLLAGVKCIQCARKPSWVVLINREGHREGRQQINVTPSQHFRGNVCTSKWSYSEGRCVIFCFLLDNGTSQPCLYEC